jgi:hypothetical protein
MTAQRNQCHLSQRVCPKGTPDVRILTVTSKGVNCKELGQDLPSCIAQQVPVCCTVCWQGLIANRAIWRGTATGFWRGNMPRFVILEHDHPHLHWDLMLEGDGSLFTWRLADPPSLDRPVNATPQPAHRTMYLDYEGEVSGGRGAVRRWDCGEFDWVSRIDPEFEIRLLGSRISGRGYLRRDASGDLRFSVTPERTSSGESVS